MKLPPIPDRTAGIPGRRIKMSFERTAAPRKALKLTEAQIAATEV